MVVPGPHGGEGAEGEGALHLAHVVLEDGLPGEGLRQVEAVLDLEALAERPLLGACAHHAGARPPRVAGFDVEVVDLARDALLPQVEVEAGEGVAVDPRVEEGVGDVEVGALDGGDLVGGVADDLGEGHLADLRELGVGEADERVAGLVPEAVALAQVAELDADDAGEGGTDEAAVEGGLRQAT